MSVVQSPSSEPLSALKQVEQLVAQVAEAASQLAQQTAEIRETLIGSPVVGEDCPPESYNFEGRFSEICKHLARTKNTLADGIEAARNVTSSL